MRFLTLPIELYLELLKHLSVKDIVNFSQLNKKFNVICNDEIFWKNRLGIDVSSFLNKEKQEIIEEKRERIEIKKSLSLLGFCMLLEEFTRIPRLAFLKFKVNPTIKDLTKLLVSINKEEINGSYFFIYAYQSRLDELLYFLIQKFPYSPITHCEYFSLLDVVIKADDGKTFKYVLSKIPRLSIPLKNLVLATMASRKSLNSFGYKPEMEILDSILEKSKERNKYRKTLNRIVKYGNDIQDEEVIARYGKMQRINRRVVRFIKNKIV